MFIIASDIDNQKAKAKELREEKARVAAQEKKKEKEKKFRKNLLTVLGVGLTYAFVQQAFEKEYIDYDGTAFDEPVVNNEFELDGKVLDAYFNETDNTVTLQVQLDDENNNNVKYIEDFSYISFKGYTDEKTFNQNGLKFGK